MKTNRSAGQNCDQVHGHLDGYLDRELEPVIEAQVSSHLSSCAACAEDQANRLALQSRLRTAMNGVTVPPEVALRIQNSLRSTPSYHGGSWRKGLMAAAAAITICIGSMIAYQLGHLRMSAASQESYIASISPKVVGIMRVGLGDHIHCAVFRKYPKNPPTAEHMAADLGPEYTDLIGIVQKRVPTDYHVVLGHQCRYHGRPFVHLTASNGARLISLVIARRGDESFSRENLAPALTASGIPIYRAGVQRFEIAGFETRDHLVYVVSDTGALQNSEVMTALAPELRKFLSKPAA